MNDASEQGGGMWSVSAQQEVTAPDAQGRYVPGVKVSFTTRAGLSGSVFVPDAQYNPANVRQAVEQRVAQMLTVHGLGG